MYAWIEKAPPDEKLQLRWWTLDCTSPPAAPPRGLEAIRALLEERRHTQPDAEQTRLQTALEAMLPWLPAEPVALEHGLRLGLLHHSQPAAERAQREQTIAQHMAEVLGPPAQWPASRREALQAVQRMAVLTPNPFMHDHLPSVIYTHLAADFSARSSMQALTKDEQALEQAVNHIIEVCGGRHVPCAKSTLMAASLLAPPGLRLSMVAMLLDFKNAGRADWINALLTGVSDPSFPGYITARCDALNQGMMQLRHMVDNKLESPAEAAEIAAATGQHMHNGFVQAAAKAMNELVNALDQGVPMGQRGTQALQWCAEQAQREQEQAVARSGGWLRRQAVGNRPPETAPLPGAMSSDDVTTAWIDQQTVDLLEGPVATTEEAPPLDRRKAREKLQARNTRARTPSSVVPNTPRQTQPAAPAKPTKNDDDWTDNDVTLLLQQALSHSAHYFRDEINDLIERAKLLGAPTPVIEQAHSLVSTLDAIAKDPPVRESGPRRTFAQAELVIQAMRQAIKKAEGDERLREQFDRALTLALARETLKRGRRSGGQIACPLSPTDWGWVEQRYHRRWLSGASTLVTEDGVVTPLRNNEALALHVTAKSLSGALFDVSVHLWRRHGAARSAPSDNQEPYPPMNEHDWYDTYIPCTVLHIPPK